jgi:glycerophosphoryl diester phosphodiesterase
MLLSHSTLLKVALGQRRSRERVAFLKAQPYAHRGLHGAGVPENSRAAFAAARAAGHGIELDVQLSADGEPFVFHDLTLERLTDERGPLADFTGKELTAIRLSGTAETIPPLSDVLNLVDGRVPVLIEVKSPGRSVNMICLGVRRALEGYRGAVGVMSFDPRIGAWFAEHAERIPRGLVMTLKPPAKRFDPLRTSVTVALALHTAKPDFLAVDIECIGTAVPMELRKLGMPVVTWTVRTAAQERLALAHADEIIYEKIVG